MVKQSQLAPPMEITREGYALPDLQGYKDGQPVTTNKDQVNSHRIILDTGALFLLKVSSGE
ncbi:hypothetical protein ANCDUO_03974 [Ancylostoma duodenale]|uniref:Uncharacterized protein n=1 Tax=Ancylostoma duodenale TaxID=51022 RepID=A0A0C2GW08_9BILA|nr:hypothetical protein ANCDUO_03974 [Ancylostoma duodenale]